MPACLGETLALGLRGRAQRRAALAAEVERLEGEAAAAAAKAAGGAAAGAKAAGQVPKPVPVARSQRREEL